MPDPHEAFGQYVQHQATQKLRWGYGGLLAMTRVKSDLSIIDMGNTSVANGNAMGVSPQVCVDGRGVTKGRFAIDSPILFVQPIEPLFKCGWLLQCFATSREIQFDRCCTGRASLQATCRDTGRSGLEQETRKLGAYLPNSHRRR